MAKSRSPVKLYPYLAGSWRRSQPGHGIVADLMRVSADRGAEMVKGRTESGLFIRIGEGSARGDGAGFRCLGGFHRLGAAALTARPWQGDLRLGAGCDCRLHPTRLLFHALSLSEVCAVLKIISLGIAAGIWLNYPVFKKIFGRAGSDCGGRARIVGGRMARIIANLETIGRIVAGSPEMGWRNCGGACRICAGIYSRITEISRP